MMPLLCEASAPARCCSTNAFSVTKVFLAAEAGVTILSSVGVSVLILEAGGGIGLIFGMANGILRV